MNKTTEALKLALEKAQMLMQPIPDKEVTALEIAKAVSERALELCQILEEALVNPVKQEPVGYTNKEQLRLLKDPRNPIGMWTTPFQTNNVPLYAAPVDTKAIRAEALEEAIKIVDNVLGRQNAVSAAIRGLK